MPRKEDKLRPYRVDYFDIDEMKDNDFALVRSTIVRTVTADGAIYLVQRDKMTANGVAVLGINEPTGRIVIRAYRYYKNLTQKADVYKAVEDLFTESKAIKVMEVVEAYRAAKATPAPAPVDAPTVSATPTTFLPLPPEPEPEPPVQSIEPKQLDSAALHDFVPDAESFIEPNEPVGPAARPPMNVPCCDASQDEASPFLKTVVFGGVILLVFGIIYGLLAH